MEKVAIQLEEKKGIARLNEPVGLGIPLPESTVQTIHQLAVMDRDELIDAQFTPLSHWPDGSIRWVKASFLISLDACGEKTLALARTAASYPRNLRSPLDKTTNSAVIHTSTGSITLEPCSLAWRVTNQNSADISSRVTLSDETGFPCTAKAETNWKVTHEGPVFVTAKLTGQWLTQANEPLARFDCELRIFLETGLVQLELTTHNPKRARHPGGLWDLGDPNSVYFQELAVETTLPDTDEAKVIPQSLEKAAQTFQLPGFNLYQDSSGGENWQSRNHVDGNGEVSTQFRGYRLSTSSDLLHEGKRANPLVSIAHNCGQLSVAVPDFWQNFPTSVRNESNKLNIGLFPRDAKNAYELQGGERKTLRCFIAPDSTNSSIAAAAYAPLVPVLAAESYEQADAFPWLKANTRPGALDELIAEGLNGRSNFFEKREVIDEFGWRNFGDIFADHETLYQKDGEPPFISHYNNQYDPIYGFARQFALTGDRRWFQLMDDLARHVVDIDIYHTDEDRAEYNNGLFWHTDHYLDAYTATHRTFSRHNNTSSTPGQTGGGPAEEHCYSTGLLYHYCLTGNEKSRQAVLGLAHWMTALHEGQGGLLEQILTLKRREVPALKKLMRGETVSTHRYGFNRGTGNYLNTLLDSWILDQNGSWLQQAEEVIRNTIHPLDLIEQRDLLDVENRWSYLILLAALFRYLYLKRQIDCKDEQYEYTKESVLHYTRWMLSNERPFMEEQSQLEFPNDTWVAQDVRKAMLMFQASELDHGNGHQYWQLGQKWLEEFTGTLKHSDERHFSRILIILMQNHGPHMIAARTPLIHDPAKQIQHHWTPSILTWSILLSRIGRRVLRALTTFRPSREKHWLNTRLDRH